MSPFRASWNRCWRSIGATESGGEVYAALIAAYREPQRKYHTLQHLGECLACFEFARALAAHPAEVETALWFHDAIYDVSGAGNERRSADWARVIVLENGGSAAVAHRIYSLVLATQHRGVPADPMNNSSSI
jgi:predicted metal-dependent HD superfamily phosphohydrolase